MVDGIVDDLSALLRLGAAASPAVFRRQVNRTGATVSGELTVAFQGQRGAPGTPRWRRLMLGWCVSEKKGKAAFVM